MAPHALVAGPHRPPVEPAQRHPHQDLLRPRLRCEGRGRGAGQQQVRLCRLLAVHAGRRRATASARRRATASSGRRLQVCLLRWRPAGVPVGRGVRHHHPQVQGPRRGDQRGEPARRSAASAARGPVPAGTRATCLVPYPDPMPLHRSPLPPPACIRRSSTAPMSRCSLPAATTRRSKCGTAGHARSKRSRS